MKMTYDPVADAAYIYVASAIQDGEAVQTTVCEVPLKLTSVNLDFDVHGRLLGVEILGASRLLRPECLRNV